MKHKQNGIQGAIQGVLSGEYATEIVNAEPAGAIVTFSSGRFAHITVRDPQGKPAIGAQFLKSTARPTGTGIFSGLRNVLSSTPWKRRIVAAKAGRSTQRGQRDIVIATNSGTIEVWDTHWNHGNNLATTADVRRVIEQSLEERNLGPNDDEKSLQLLDFAIRDDEVDEGAIESQLSLWILLAVSRGDSPSYFIVGVTISEGLPVCGPTYSVNYPNRDLGFVTRWPPRILVPKPGDTAFVIFEDGLALVSLVPLNRSPSPMLDDDVEEARTQFQDFIRFRDSQRHSILGFGSEDRSDSHRYPSCVIMARNFGLFRVSVRPRPMQGPGEEEGRITVKSRLEQIVFYEKVSPTVLEKASLEVSDEILRSTSPYVATALPSLEQQMKLRASALQRLAVFLNESRAELAYRTRWKLLWGAEKIAAQIAIWRVQQSLKEQEPNKPTHLERILGQMGEKFRTKVDADAGELDPVRQWFIRDTWRMEHIIPWILNGVRDAGKSSSSKGGLQLAPQIYQASKLSLATLETAFQFREENAPLYGLGNEYGGLEEASSPQYSELPEFWTSQSVNYSETDELLNAELNTCVKWIPSPKVPAPDKQTAKALTKLKENIPRQFKALSRIYAEKKRWCAAQHALEPVEAGRKLQRIYSEHRKTALFKMAAIDLAEEAIKLAEDFDDMNALAELMIDLREETKRRYAQQRVNGSTPEGLDEELKQLKQRIDNYFERLGEKWADAWFTRYIAIGTPAALLTECRDYQQQLTRFLRRRPGYAKLSWINDVLGEGDYASAANTLSNLAATQESDLWSKKVETALAKLGKLSVIQLEQHAPDVAASLEADNVHLTWQLRLTAIQENLYAHICPALHGALDSSAELQLANEQFGKVLVDSKPALREALQRGLAKVVGRCPAAPDELIDVLTLMDPIRWPEVEGDEVIDNEFALALRVLKASEMGRKDPSYRDILEKIIWRRCMIRDDWEKINVTNQKGDEEMEATIRATALFRTLAECAEGELFNFSIRHVHPFSLLINLCP
jgi:nuclear pore complex protein Nup133